MKKIQWMNRINFIVLGIILGVDIILGILFAFDIRFYYSSILLLALSGLINLIFIAIKEFSVLSYDSRHYDPVMHAGFIIIGVAAYYIVTYVKGYERFYVLYWVVVIILAIIVSIVTYLLNLKNKRKQQDKNKGPKFMVNHK